MSCEHRSQRVNPDECVKCGREVPDWYLTEHEARLFYDALGLGDLAAAGIARLTGPAASEYSWTSYLRRDNAGEAVDEMLDGIHYALFDVLRSRMLELDGLSDTRADAARVELVAAAQAIAVAVRCFERAQKGLKA